MKKFIYLVSIVILLYGCNDSTSPDENPIITIEILQNGTTQETYIITEYEDGDIYPIFYNDQQIGETEVYISECLSDPPEDERIITFHSIARKYDNYSIINTVNHYDTLRIDYQQDFDVINENFNCGTIYDPVDGLIVNARFSVWIDSVFIDSLFTDDFGRFETAIESNNYILKSGLFGGGYFETEFNLLEGYSDYSYPDYYLYDYKPNIYIYPTNPINLDINILFPKSGKVVKSIPEFPMHWQNLQIEPDGKINDEYDYLFYESIQPNIFQKTKGWIIKLENLENFFKQNLHQSGFVENEINDFIEYWIPKLTDSKYYAIYPQYSKQLDPLIKLDFSQQPDKILRLTYYISKLKSKETELVKPEIPSFEREGFVVTEWGLIFDESE